MLYVKDKNIYCFTTTTSITITSKTIILRLRFYTCIRKNIRPQNRIINISFRVRKNFKNLAPVLKLSIMSDQFELNIIFEWIHFILLLLLINLIVKREAAVTITKSC